MTSANAAPSPPSNSRLRLALMASLALNVLIIGAVAGTLLMSRQQGWNGHKGKQSGLIGFAQTLPADRAEIIRAKIASEEATLAPLRKAERDARDAARAILMQEPFDAEKFKAALARAAEADAKPFSSAKGNQGVRQLVSRSEGIRPRIHESQNALHAVGR